MAVESQLKRSDQRSAPADGVVAGFPAIDEYPRPSIGDDVLEPTHAGRDDRHAARLRLGCDQPKRLAAGRDHHHVGSPVELRELGVRHGLMEVDDTCEIGFGCPCDQTVDFRLTARA